MRKPYFPPPPLTSPLLSGPLLRVTSSLSPRTTFDTLIKQLVERCTPPFRATKVFRHGIFFSKMAVRHTPEMQPLEHVVLRRMRQVLCVVLPPPASITPLLSPRPLRVVSSVAFLNARRLVNSSWRRCTPPYRKLLSITPKCRH